MSLRRKLALLTLGAVAALPVRAASAADNLQTTLAKLDQAAARFRSTSADFKFVTVQTDPVPDTDTLQGAAYYERSGNDFKMAAHIDTDNGRPAKKVYMFTQGQFRLYEPGIHQITVFTRANKFADYIMLGFGASGKQLADKWDITDLGPEAVDGVQTEKLELVAKDPTVRKNLPKVTVWMDLNRAISLKQVFDEGQGQTRTCAYTNIKTNQSLPTGVFEIHDSQAQTSVR
jgi:outer membrane lipoprotein-sorting protein